MSEEAATAPLHADAVPDAIGHALASACDVRLKLVENQTPSTDEPAVAAIVTLAGDLDWSAFMALPASTAAKVASAFAGLDVDFDSPDMDDSIGELTNLFIGRLKTVLADRGAAVEASFPGVLKSQTLAEFVEQAGPVDLYCFQSTMGNVWAGVIR